MSITQRKSAFIVLKSKIFKRTVILILLAEILFLVYLFSIKELKLFPNSKQFTYNFFSDSLAGGNSQFLEKKISSKAIKFSYKIGTKIGAPYLGISVYPKENSEIDFSQYNQLNISVKGEVNGIGIAIVTRNIYEVPNVKEMLFYHIFKKNSQTNTYSIPIHKFTIPDWWGESHRIEEAATIKPNLKYLKIINISSAFTPHNGKVQQLEITAITFSRNNTYLILLSIVTVLLTSLILFFVLFFKTKKTIPPVITITYKPIEIENEKPEVQKNDFVDYINKNFHKSELTLELISSETGTSQRKITLDIQNRFGCNLKTYINKLRMNESKRLLLETDLPIGEIAFIVGFNNQTHFNRVFKAEMQISPTEFRLKNKKIEEKKQ